MSARVVVITGAAGGIGAATMARFAAQGDTPVGLDLLAAPEHARVIGGFDITDPAQCEAVAQRIIDEHGRIDVLCNNAGIAAVGDVVQSTPDDWQRVFAVNVFGIANMSRAVLPHMRAAGGGAVVNTCSIVATVGLVQRAVYGASKGAVQALTKAMAADEIGYGIRVNCVSPGTVESPWVQRLVANTEDPESTYAALRKRQPMGDLVSCEAVADAVAYLAAPTTFTTGTDLLVDGGISGIRIVDSGR
jgi:2-keto-3-deoxy-L-fuconate dehydrogenase